MYKSQINGGRLLANPTLTKGETDVLGIGGKAELRKNYMADIGDEILEYFKKRAQKKFKEFEKEILIFNTVLENTKTVD